MPSALYWADTGLIRIISLAIFAGLFSGHWQIGLKMTLVILGATIDDLASHYEFHHPGESWIGNSGWKVFGTLLAVLGVWLIFTNR